MADYLKIKEVAERLEVSPKTARKYIRNGTIPSSFIAGAYKVHRDDLERYLEEARVAPKARSPRDGLVGPGAGDDEYPGLAQRFAKYEARARQIAAGDDLPLAAPSVALEAEEDARRMAREGVLPESVVHEYLLKASEITRIVMDALDARERDLVREIAAISEQKERLGGIARDEGRARSAS